MCDVHAKDRAARAAVVRSKAGGFIIKDLRLAPPTPNEVLVRIIATGVAAKYRGKFRSERDNNSRQNDQRHLEGDSIPQRLIPELIEFYPQGRFPADRLVKFYSIEQSNEAMADAGCGGVIKPILRMPANG